LGNDFRENVFRISIFVEKSFGQMAIQGTVSGQRPGTVTNDYNNI